MSVGSVLIRPIILRATKTEDENFQSWYCSTLLHGVMARLHELIVATLIMFMAASPLLLTVSSMGCHTYIMEAAPSCLPYDCRKQW